MGLGYAVLAAADAADAGADGAAVEAAAADVAARCRVFFSVDTLDRLRRGGRIGAAAALRRHRARGQAAAARRAGPDRAAGEGAHHRARRRSGSSSWRRRRRATGRSTSPCTTSARPPRAEEVAARLRERLPDVTRLLVSEVGAVIGAHVGLGLLGVVVVPARALIRRRRAAPSLRCG